MEAPRAILTLHSDVGGTNQGPIPFLVGNRHRRRLDGRDKFEFTAADGPWRHLVRRRISCVKVVLPWVVAPWPGTFWWRVFGFTVGKGTRDSASVKVVCEPLSLVMRDAGRMRLQDGARWLYSTGSERATARFYYESFVFPQVHRRGATWFQLGDVEDDGQYEIKWYGKTGQWLHEQIKTITGLEQEVEHVSPTLHRLHMRRRVGEDAPEVVAADGRNVISIVRSQSGQGFASIIAGFGMVPQGSTERASMALAAWRVAARDTGLDQVQLEDRNGGDPPDMIDNQSQGCFLRDKLGAYWEILSTVADSPNVFQLEAGGAAAFEVDDDVEIRLDADGTLRDELRDPDVESGFVASAFERDFYRGERNYALNPRGLVWTTKPESLGVRTNGLHTPQAEDISLDGIVPTNRVIETGALIVQPIGFIDIETTTEDRTAIAGAETFAIAPPLPASNIGGAGPIPDNTPIAIYENPASLPDRWTAPQADTPSTPIAAYYPVGLKDLFGSCAIATPGASDGFFTITGIVDENGDPVDGDPDGEIYPGDALVGPSGWCPIVVRSTISGGSVEVLVSRNSAQMSLAATAPGTFPVSIYRMRVAGDRPQASVCMLISRKLQLGTGQITLAPQIDTEPVVVTPIPGFANVLVVWEVTVRGALALGFSGFGGTTGFGGSPLQLAPPRMEVFDGDTLIAEGSVDAGVSWAGDGTNIPPVDKPLVLKALVPLDRPLLLRTRLHGPAMNTSGFLGQFCTAVQSVNLQVGSEDSSAGAAWPSFANSIHQEANRQLLIARQLTEEWAFEVIEFWERFQITPPEPQVVLGGSLFARTSLNGNQGIRFRFTEVDHSLDGPKGTKFKALARTVEAMELINRAIRQGGDGGGGSVSGGTLVLPGSGSSGGTGGGGAGGTGSIFRSRSDARPRANHLSDYLHQVDQLDIVQWFGNAWDEIIEATRGDQRAATTWGTELAECLTIWEEQAQGWTQDNDGVRVLAPISES